MHAKLYPPCLHVCWRYWQAAGRLHMGLGLMAFMCSASGRGSVRGVRMFAQPVPTYMSLQHSPLECTHLSTLLLF